MKRMIEINEEEPRNPVRTVLADREAELLELKGHCSNRNCTLHYAHRGPCVEK